MKRQFREATPQTKAKLSAIKSGVNNPMYGQKHSEETKRLISQALKKYWETVPSRNNK
ncbi:MAG: hypothetical protein LBH46_00230 [Rickettsiales bacterium]|jgi:hypothetical protein|nr:hypothetical protein [Rickettsiales bacterium]